MVLNANHLWLACCFVGFPSNTVVDTTVSRGEYCCRVKLSIFTAKFVFALTLERSLDLVFVLSLGRMK